MEKQEKGSRLEPSKKSLIWLALLLLVGLLTVLLVLMINIDRDNKFIITSLLPLAEEANVIQISPCEHKLTEFRKLYQYFFVKAQNNFFLEIQRYACKETHFFWELLRNIYIFNFKFLLKSKYFS